MLDTFQRYMLIYKLIEREANRSRSKMLRLLDVGSNGPGFASYNYFYNIDQTNLDIIEADKDIQDRYPKVKFVKYSGELLPFENNSFDFVICVDVLEHIPPEKRNRFIQDVIRVSQNHIIFVFPVKSSENWEKFLSLITFRKIKFLQEHIEYGLPNEQDFYDAVLTQNRVRTIEEAGNFNIWLWIPIKLISSLLFFLLKGHDDLIYKCFLLYKSTLSNWINWGRCYSKVFVLEKNQ